MGRHKPPKENWLPNSKIFIKEKKAGKSIETEVSMFRARCNGVKVNSSRHVFINFFIRYFITFQICAGGEGGDQSTTCDYAVSNRVQSNRCLIHPEASSIATGSCSGCFVYLFPVAPANTRRWLAFIGDVKGRTDGHSHPEPVRSKLGSKLEQAVEKAVENDPTLTTDDNNTII